MELVTGMPQMHATDVVAVVQPSGHIACSNFNVVVNKGYLGTVRASVDMNERTTDLILIHDQQAGCFLFPGGKLTPEPQMLSSLPLSIGRNRMEFRVLDNSSGDRICVSADLWLYHSDDRIVVMDVDGTITKSDVRSQRQAVSSRRRRRRVRQCLVKLMQLLGLSAGSDVSSLLLHRKDPPIDHACTRARGRRRRV